MKRKHIIEFGVPDIRNHDDDPDRCWCEPVTIYVSDATGRKMTLHRTFPPQAPSQGLVMLSKVRLDAEDYDNPADYG